MFSLGKYVTVLSSVFLGTFAKLQEVTFGFVMSACLHGTTQLPLDRFS
jgi:hypothetical protein